MLATESGAPDRLARLLALIAELAFLYAFWRLGSALPAAQARHELLTIEGAVGRLGIAGVTAAAILSGEA